MWVDGMEGYSRKAREEEKWSILFCICSAKSDSKGPKEGCRKDS